MLGNSITRYGGISQLLHWGLALLIIGLFALGVWMVELDYYDEWSKTALDTHKSVGVLVIVLMLFRFVYQLSQPRPMPPEQHSRLVNRLSRGIQLYFYLALAGMFVSGYLISTVQGQAIDVFNWFSLPSIYQNDGNLEDLAGMIHEFLAWSIIAAAVLHMAGALKHHFIDRDTTLIRMLPWR